MEKKTRKKSNMTKTFYTLMIIATITIIATPLIIMYYNIQKNGGNLTGLLPSVIDTEKSNMFYKLILDNKEYVVDDKGKYIKNGNSYIKIIGLTTTQKELESNEKLNSIDMDKLDDIKDISQFFYRYKEETLINISNTDENIVTMGNKQYHFKKDLSYIAPNILKIRESIENTLKDNINVAGDLYLFDNMYFKEKTE